MLEILFLALLQEHMELQFLQPPLELMDQALQLVMDLDMDHQQIPPLLELPHMAPTQDLLLPHQELGLLQDILLELLMEQLVLLAELAMELDQLVLLAELPMELDQLA